MECAVSLTVIAKSAAALLPACLSSAKDLVADIFVIDTGSTDDTKMTALRLGARVTYFTCEDSFAAARNESLRHATGDWIVWLNADEYFDEQNQEKVRALFAQLPDDNVAFIMKLRSPPTRDRKTALLVDHVRLFRNRPEHRWQYRVHEQILPAFQRTGAKIVWTDIDNANHLTSESDNYSTYALSYDNAGRITSVDNNGSPSIARVILTYGFDDFGNRTSMSDNASHTVSYSYLNAERLTQITASGTPAWSVNLSYDVTNNVTGISRIGGGKSDVEIASTISYDTGNRLTDITHVDAKSATSLGHFTYTFDNADRITGYTGPEGTVTLTYGNTNQLTGASGARTETFTYDANGNRTMSGYTTGTANRYSAGAGFNFTHDYEGNLLTQTRVSDGQVTEFSWDYRNRLTQVIVKTSGGTTLTTDNFTYDVENRRIGKSVNGTAVWTAYDGVNPHADFNSGGSMTALYLSGLEIDQMFARYNGTNIAWYLRDNINSVRSLVQSTGTVLDQIDYGSFGNITNETSPSNGDRFKYTGREWDSEIGLYNYRIRFDAPAMGRFVSEDPIGFSARDPNLYRYVANAPTRFTDPSGTQLSLTRANPKLLIELGIVAGGTGALATGKPQAAAIVAGDFVAEVISGGITIGKQLIEILNPPVSNPPRPVHIPQNPPGPADMPLNPPRPVQVPFTHSDLEVIGRIGLGWVINYAYGDLSPEDKLRAENTKKLQEQLDKLLEELGNIKDPEQIQKLVMQAWLLERMIEQYWK